MGNAGDIQLRSSRSCAGSMAMAVIGAMFGMERLAHIPRPPHLDVPASARSHGRGGRGCAPPRSALRDGGCRYARRGGRDARRRGPSLPLIFRRRDHLDQTPVFKLEAVAMGELDRPFEIDQRLAALAERDQPPPDVAALRVELHRVEGRRARAAGPAVGSNPHRTCSGGTPAPCIARAARPSPCW